MTKVAFISYADGSYERLHASFKKSVLLNYPKADVLCFNKFSDIGSPTHAESPYAFKIYAIERARDLGYEVVIWCDSCQRLVNSPVEFIQTIEKVGVYLQRDGWATGQWANDKALEYFGVTRDEAMKITAVYACIIGFDFRHPITTEFLKQWKEASKNGIFFGKWKNTDKTESQDDRCLGHRHDQTSAELIANKMGIELQALVTDSVFKGWIDIN